MKQGKSIKELTLGESVTMTRTFTDHDVRQFAQMSGDNNPMHLDENYASKTQFKHRIAHGHLVSSMFSSLLGMELPGLGTIYLKQDLKYIAPVYLNDTITAEVKVCEIYEERNRVKLETNAYNQDGQQVIVGMAEVMPPKKG